MAAARAHGGVDVDGVVNAYQRYAAGVAIQLRRGLYGTDPVADTKEEADVMGAAAGLAITLCACAAEPPFEGTRTVVVRELLSRVLMPRFPWLDDHQRYVETFQTADETFYWLLDELTRQDIILELLGLIEIPLPARTFVDDSIALADAVVTAAGRSSRRTAWLAEFTAELRERLDNPPFLRNLPSAEEHEEDPA